MTERKAPAKIDPQPLDRWTVWFNRLVQVAGLGIVAHEEITGHAQAGLLLVAAAMMLGGIGLRLLVRGARKMLEPFE
jgi:hypothetical protein